MVKVLVCGAAGWLGRAITDVMIESGFEVRAFDRDMYQWTAWENIPSAGMNGRLSEQDSPNIKGYVNGRHVGNASIQRAIIGHGGRIEMRYGDITDYKFVEELVEGVDAIIHATAYFPRESSDEMAWRVNCGGLWNVLDCARKSGTVKRVVHIGRSAAAAPHPTPPTHPPPHTHSTLFPSLSLSDSVALSETAVTPNGPEALNLLVRTSVHPLLVCSPPGSYSMLPFGVRARLGLL